MRRLEQKQENQVTCVFSEDDKVDQELNKNQDMEVDEEMWALPQFLDEDELMGEFDQFQQPLLISKTESINSNSTCHSDFGNQNGASGNLIESFTGNQSYLSNIDGSLKLRRQNAMRFDKIEKPAHPVMTAQEAQQ